MVETDVLPVTFLIELNRLPEKFNVYTRNAEISAVMMIITTVDHLRIRAINPRAVIAAITPAYRPQYFPDKSPLFESIAKTATARAAKR